MYTHAWLFIVDVACIAVIFTASCASAAATRWWPAFPLPNRLYVLEDQGSYARQVAAETLAGLLARRDRLRGPGPMIWLDQGNPDYTRWLRMFLARHKVPETRHPGGLWTLVRKFHRAGIVRGYILYNPGTKDDPHDLSVNWATSLCGPMGGIAVDASQQAEAKRVGLPMLADARGKDFAWMLAKLHHRYTRRQLCLLQPGQPNLRDEAVAAGALTTLDVPGGGYRHALSLMQPGGIVFGWGVSEYNSVMMASRYALRVVCSDWASNIPVLSSGHTGLAYMYAPAAPHPAPAYEPGHRYLSFIISDGDNLQWAIGGFGSDPDLWASPQRGRIPFGWSLPLIDLMQTNPYEITWLQAHAHPDDELLQFGLGYFFLDDYGQTRGGPAALTSLLRTERPYLARLHLHVLLVFTHKWDSPAALRGYEAIADELPDVRAVLAIQYDPYAAGRGAIRWFYHLSGRPMAVITPRTFLWNQGQGQNNDYFQWPDFAAKALNTWASGRPGGYASQFAWVGIHAWSKFPLGKSGRPISQYNAAVYTAKHLGRTITVVTPGQLADLLIAARTSQE